MLGKQFRMQYTKFGLTYSRCPIPREKILELIQSKMDLTEYYIARETHKEEKACPYHLHIWAEASSKPNIKNPAYFDFQYEGKTYHPNIQKAQKNWIWNYLKKQDTEPLTNIPEGYVDIAKDGDTEEAMRRFSNEHPKEFVINFDRIKKHLKLLGKRKREDIVYPFTGDIVDIEDGKSLLLIDEPGKGKTEWAKSFVVHHLQKTYLRVTHIDTLKKYDGEDVLIFDDVDFQHLPRETQIHLAEVRNARSIHCRHTVADIPPGVLNIFLGNQRPFMYGDAAIDRRLQKAPSIRFFKEPKEH